MQDMTVQNARSKGLLRPLQSIRKDNIPLYDFHLHTNWTDGNDTLMDMYNAACSRKLHAVLFSEHVRKTSGDWFDRFVYEIRSIKGDSCAALVGLETRVLDFEGNLDCTDDMMKQCDLIVASVHRFPSKVDGRPIDFVNIEVSEAMDIEYNLIMGLLENDKVDILGHPFGMSIKKFNIRPSAEKMMDVIKKAAKKGIAVEINAAYHTNLWQLIEWCQEYGAFISLGSDAHSIQDIGFILRKLERGDI